MTRPTSVDRCFLKSTHEDKALLQLPAGGVTPLTQAEEAYVSSLTVLDSNPTGSPDKGLLLHTAGVTSVALPVMVPTL